MHPQLPSPQAKSSGSPTKIQAFQALKSGLDLGAARQTVSSGERLVRSGFEELDRALGGGFPRGAIGTLEGTVSSGRTAIAAGLLTGATARGLAAVVDDGSFYPPGLAAAGVRLERLLVAPAGNALGVARAADILLRSRAFDVVIVPAAPLKTEVWSRLAGLTQKADALLLVLGASARTELAYFASARVGCAIERVLWCNESGPFCELGGYEIRASVLKHRRAAPGATARIRVLAKGNGAPLRERAVQSRRLSAVMN
ncbi:MAG: hypothetical protein ACXWNK_18305 [Vulcanimicrobiaceae bacterium]